MAVTYNDLTLDIRRSLRQAGIEAATLEARELVCFAAGKDKARLLRDGALYASPETEETAWALARSSRARPPRWASAMKRVTRGGASRARSSGVRSKVSKRG